MPPYFHGWRRKLGVATLVMACVFMGEWMRSGLFADELSFKIGELSALVFESVDHHLCFCTIHCIEPEKLPMPTFVCFKTYSYETLDFCFSKRAGFTWAWRLCDFGAVKTDDPHYDVRVLVIPYWSIVIPLTLLSVSLLLSKPRTQKKPTTDSLNLARFSKEDIQL